MKRMMGAALLTAMMGMPVLAQDVTGTWLRENGESRVRFAKCGDALCGTVAWLKDPANSPSKIGQRVFYDMKPTGDGSWSGSAFNPEDGKTYTGKMTLSGNRLTTSGCVFGGMICRSVNWSRVN
jgi:uncharacterized protein (DUF2147 family)